MKDLWTVRLLPLSLEFHSSFSRQSHHDQVLVDSVREQLAAYISRVLKKKRIWYWNVDFTTEGNNIPVGQRVKDEKNAAKNPENALSRVDASFLPWSPVTRSWQTPYPQKRTEFSATFAMMAGIVPAYSPFLMPSLRTVCLRHIRVFGYMDGNVCILTLIVSSGCPGFRSWYDWSAAEHKRYRSLAHAYQNISDAAKRSGQQVDAAGQKNAFALSVLHLCW